MFKLKLPVKRPILLLDNSEDKNRETHFSLYFSIEKSVFFLSPNSYFAYSLVVRCVCVCHSSNEITCIHRRNNADFLLLPHGKFLCSVYVLQIIYIFVCLVLAIFVLF